MSAFVAPAVRFYGPEKSALLYGEDAGEWHRIQPAEQAHAATGFDLESDEPELGIGITRRGADTIEFDFDLIRLGMKLRPAVVERLRDKWSAQLAANTPKRFRERGHFSASFAEFPTRREFVEEWKQFLETILNDPASYQTPLRQRKKENEHTESL